MLQVLHSFEIIVCGFFRGAHNGQDLGAKLCVGCRVVTEFVEAPGESCGCGIAASQENSLIRGQWKACDCEEIGMKTHHELVTNDLRVTCIASESVQKREGFLGFRKLIELVVIQRQSAVDKWTNKVIEDFDGFEILPSGNEFLNWPRINQPMMKSETSSSPKRLTQEQAA